MTQISFDALEKALAPIESIGKRELAFDVNGTSVTLRVLLPEEEIDSQRYAAEAIPKEDAERTPQDTLNYLERFKISILAHALVAIGKTDLRDVKFVETGETLDNGQKVKEPRHLAMRRLLAKWTGDTRSRMFNKYADLLMQVEIDTERAIKYEPADLDTEIERLETRVQQLRDERERRKAPAAGKVISDQVKAVADLDNLGQHEKQEAASQLLASRAGVTPKQDPVTAQTAPVAPVQPVPQQPQPRVPVYAQMPKAPPPPPTPQEAPRPPAPMATSQAQPEAPRLTYPDESFVDAGDADAMAAAIADENRRLMAMRQGQVIPSASPSVLNSIRPTRPPHLDAKEVADSLDSEENRVLVESRNHLAQPSGTRDGVDVFKAAPEVLDRPVVIPPGQPNRPSINVGQRGAVNPRFKPVKQEP